MTTSRRTFLGYSALALSSANASASVAPAGLDTIGVQLYSVRNVLGDKAASTLMALDQIGYREAEVTWGNVDAIWADLKKTRLRPVSIHMDSALFLPDKSSQLNAAISHCKELGFQYVVYPYLPPKERGGLDVMKALADTLNRAGEECRKAGMHCCYHNHAFEFEPVEKTNGMETLLNRMDKKLVQWEMDVFWVSVGGQDPVAMLRQYAGRVPLLHLKDKAPGMKIQYNETVPPTAFREVGNGTLDIPAILRAASSAGVQHYFVEQDQTPGDATASLRQSFDYLRKLPTDR